MSTSRADKFDEGPRSLHLIEAYKQKLAAEAVEIQRQYPAARIAGLILEGGTPYAEHFRRAREHLLGRAAGEFDVATLVNMEAAVELLREWSPASGMEQLERISKQMRSYAAPFIYIFVITSGGARLATADLPIRR